MKVTIHLLVTDKRARVVDAEEREDFANEVRDEFLYNNAATVELRTLEFEVPLLETPRPQEKDVSSATLATDRNFDQVITEVRTRHGAEEAERLRNRLLELLPAGTWEVTRSPNSRSIRKIS